MPPEFARQISMLTEEWIQFHSPPTRPPKVQINQWEPPPQDWVMLNFDASFIGGLGTGGWGCIARDAAGDVLCAAAGPLVDVSDPLHAEALALMRTINFAENFGMGRVIFMTDCLPLKQAIDDSNADRSQLGSLFRETKYQLQIGFIQFKLVQKSHECNMPAHKLASFGSRMVRGSERIWLNDLPPDVFSDVAGDLTVSTG